eukprot:g3137.t1
MKLADLDRQKLQRAADLSADRTGLTGLAAAIVIGVLTAYTTSIAAQEIFYLILIFFIAYLWQQGQQLRGQLSREQQKTAAERKGRTNAERLLLERKNGVVPSATSPCPTLKTSASTSSKVPDGGAREELVENDDSGPTSSSTDGSFLFRPIAIARSPYPQRCGTPRQSGICPSAVTEIRLVPCLNSAACLDGLAEYSHLWVTYVFHKNTNLAREERALQNRKRGGQTAAGTAAGPGGGSGIATSNRPEFLDEVDLVALDDEDAFEDATPTSSCASSSGAAGGGAASPVSASRARGMNKQVVKNAPKQPPAFQGLITKILPPRGDKKVGIFACRSPHRPNPIGLSLGKIEKIDATKGLICVSGLDLVDTTPVLDIKPYLPQTECHPNAKVPNWVVDSYAVETFPTVWQEGVRNALPSLMRARNRMRERLGETPRDTAVKGIKPATSGLPGDDEVAEVVQSVEEVLAMDIRSKYQIAKHAGARELFTGSLRFDGLLFQYQFDGKENVLQDVRVDGPPLDATEAF